MEVIMQLKRCIAALGTATLVLAVASCARTTKEAAATNPWARCNPGSWAIQRTTQTITVQGEQKSTVAEQKLTLQEVTADHVVLEVESTSADNQVSRQTVRVPLHGVPGPTVAGAKLPASYSLPTAPDLQTPVRRGEETLLIAGQSVQAKWVEYGDSSITKKEWTSTDVPGPWCKLLVRGGNGGNRTEMLIEVIAFEKK
jgi:hypothetical protein